MQLLISGSQKLSILPKNLQEYFPLHDPIRGSYWSLFAAGHHGVWDIPPRHGPVIFDNFTRK